MIALVTRFSFLMLTVTVASVSPERLLTSLGRGIMKVCSVEVIKEARSIVPGLSWFTVLRVAASPESVIT